VDPLTKPEWRAGVNQVLGSSWTAYTPVLTASTTSPTGWTTTGRYYRVGALIVCSGVLTAGTSATSGSGDYRIWLPVAADTTVGANQIIGTVLMYDSSANLAWTGTARVNGNADYPQVVFGAGSTFGGLAATSPWTWAAGDWISFHFTYEAAATT